jgi:flagellar biosynthesis protein
MSEFNQYLKQKAVALSYDEHKMAAPVIVASGMGYIAEKMVEVAQKHEVPVYEDNSLATLLTQLELGTQIPEELYQVIVEIYIYFLQYGKKEMQAQEKPKEEQGNTKSET